MVAAKKASLYRWHSVTLPAPLIFFFLTPGVPRLLIEMGPSYIWPQFLPFRGAAEDGWTDRHRKLTAYTLCSPSRLCHHDWCAQRQLSNISYRTWKPAEPLQNEQGQWEMLCKHGKWYLVGQLWLMLQTSELAEWLSSAKECGEGGWRKLWVCF